MMFDVVIHEALNEFRDPISVLAFITNLLEFLTAFVIVPYLLVVVVYRTALAMVRIHVNAVTITL